MTLRVQVRWTGPGGAGSGTATTLGAGGLFVETSEPLRPGTPVAIRFCLPGSDHEHEIAGRVVWARAPAVAHPHAPGMGIAFVDRAAIAELAAALDAQV